MSRNMVVRVSLMVKARFYGRCKWSVMAASVVMARFLNRFANRERRSAWNEQLVPRVCAADPTNEMLPVLLESNAEKAGL